MSTLCAPPLASPAHSVLGPGPRAIHLYRLRALLSELHLKDLHLVLPVFHLSALVDGAPAAAPLGLWDCPFPVLPLVLKLAVNVVLECLIVLLECVASLAPLARYLRQPAWVQATHMSEMRGNAELRERMEERMGAQLGRGHGRGVHRTP